MNLKKQISKLNNPEIKRIRTIIAPFSASFKDREVPLSSDAPQQTGYCRRPIPDDILYVYGKSNNGREKRVRCGNFSDELLKEIQAIKDQIVT